MVFPEMVAVDIVAAAGIVVAVARFVVPHLPERKIPEGWYKKRESEINKFHFIYEKHWKWKSFHLSFDVEYVILKAKYLLSVSMFIHFCYMGRSTHTKAHD